ncbi:Seven in absentia protein family [Popillia japonica]|uniref:Seven in absentia protein family n=1 Tax=Popillia japonica TaxID=7064 RepID=A0AAW1JD90_POPJA
MNYLKTEDLLDLSIFKCLVCTRRLGYPIMRVGLAGNVCKACYDKTPYTDSVEDTRFCALMEKLSFPCNYTAEGCTFFGSFRKTCEHEQSCFFRGRLCPFVYVNNCENKEHIHDIISHVQEQHTNNIVVVQEESITVKNACLEKPDELYFVNVGGNSFLIRILFKNESQEILYMFYRMNDNDIAKAVRFTSIAFNEDQEKCISVMSESELSFQFNYENAISVSMQKLQELDLENEIRIVVTRNDEYTNGQYLNVPIVATVWAQCCRCSNVVEEIYLPSELEVPLKSYCQSCSVYTMLTKKKYMKVDVSKLIFGYVFPCRSEGCHQLVRGDNYYAHNKYQCYFKKYACPTSGCSKTYFPQEMMTHILEAHKDAVNPKTCSLKESDVYVYVNDSDVYLQECEISKDNIFSITVIKLTEPYLDNSYYWEVHIESKVKTLSTIITGGCTVGGSKRQIYIKGYLDRGKLVFRTYIKRV